MYQETILFIAENFYDMVEESIKIFRQRLQSDCIQYYAIVAHFTDIKPDSHFQFIGTKKSVESTFSLGFTTNFPFYPGTSEFTSKK